MATLAGVAPAQNWPVPAFTGTQRPSAWRNNTEVTAPPSGGTVSALAKRPAQATSGAMPVICTVEAKALSPSADASSAEVGQVGAGFFLPALPALPPLPTFPALPALPFSAVASVGASVGAGVSPQAVVLAVAALFLLALREMLDNSVKMRYDGALDAILDVFQVMARRSEALLSLGVFGTMLFTGRWIRSRKACRSGVVHQPSR